MVYVFHQQNTCSYGDEAQVVLLSEFRETLRRIRPTEGPSVHAVRFKVHTLIANIRVNVAILMLSAQD